jgi:ABC-2 type transport system permease protein
VNAYGLWTLLRKEVRRFLRVPGQTVLSPLVTTTLYFVVFGYALGGTLREVGGVPYGRFILPGLVTLGVVTNAYLNTASSLFVMKLQGTIVDLLVSPLSYAEVLAGFLGAGVARGVLVGLVTWAVASVFAGFELAHPLLAVALLVLAATAFAALGLLTAIWATTFEQVNFFPTFVITPLTFLGGVFYSADMLPPALRAFTAANPVYYLVDGVRFGMLGTSSASPGLSFALLALVTVAAVAAALGVLRSGWRLRG